MSQEENKKLSFDEMRELRRKTEAISGFLQRQLGDYLETLRLMFLPGRILGKHAGATGDQVWGDKALAEIQQQYAEYGKPFRLPQEFNVSWLAAIGSGITLHPWEYNHEVSTGQGKRSITMSSPVRWVAAYASDTPLSAIKRMLAGKEQYRADAVRQFVVSALALQMVMDKNPGLLRLLAELRVRWEKQPMPDLHNLPVPTLSFPVPSFRPPDELILEATALSGISAFIELIDTDAVASLSDPLKARIEELIR